MQLTAFGKTAACTNRLVILKTFYSSLDGIAKL
jgi:hypothetical protein